jgi:REP element-mobilizing transposase RayT
MCRGNRGCRIFDDEQDYRGFLGRLKTVAVAYHVEIHAYALMTNHVHLFMRTREANLGRFMQRLLSGHTSWYNFRHGSYGHLFQGRYKALLVEKNAYGSAVSRYIHLNPVRVAGSGKQTVAQRQAQLRDYRWGSYRAMIGLAKAEEWLVRKDTLGRFGDTVREQQQAYAAYVEAGLTEDITDPAEEAKAQSILGRDRFVDRMRRLVCGREQRDVDAAHQRRQLLSERIERAVARVARVFGVAPEDLKRTVRGPRGNEARRVALWYAWERCAGALSARDIGKALGGVQGCTVVAAHQRMAQRIKQDKRLGRKLARLMQLSIPNA